jgi:hypothetical protein
MKTVMLTRDRVALVDDDDYERVSRHRWCAHHYGNTWYASSWIGPHKTRKRVPLHRFIVGDATGHEVDHVNGDGLDCRRSNLRLCTKAENQRNRRPNRNSTSKYKGVGWYGQYGCWRARIQVDGKKRHLGYFDNEIEAARVYDEAAIGLHGEFARLNFARGETCAKQE